MFRVSQLVANIGTSSDDGRAKFHSDRLSPPNGRRRYCLGVDVGPAELLIILAVVLLLFGSKKLPDLARGMGQAATEFRKGLRSGSDEAVDSPSAGAEPKNL